MGSGLEDALSCQARGACLVSLAAGWRGSKQRKQQRRVQRQRARRCCKAAQQLIWRQGSELDNEIGVNRSRWCIRGECNNYYRARVDGAVIMCLLPVFLSRNAEPKFGFRVSANQRPPIFSSHFPKPKSCPWEQQHKLCRSSDLDFLLRHCNQLQAIHACHMDR
jgi:hypothetical protein